MTTCPRCGAGSTVRLASFANAGRVAASLVLLPFYLLGGMAGDDRGPLLPLERRCAACGHRFRRRSVLDDVRGRQHPGNGGAAPMDHSRGTGDPPPPRSPAGSG